MPTTNASQTIAAQIDEEIKALSSELARLTRARDLLRGGKTQAATKPRAAKRKRGNRGTPRIPVAQRAEQILAALNGEEGLTASEIGPKVGVTGGYARQVLHDLLIKDGRAEIVPKSEPKRYRLKQGGRTRREPASV